MKKIEQKQIEKIMATLMDLNIPVKVYAGIQDLFNKLPEVEVPKPVEKLSEVNQEKK